MTSINHFNTNDAFSIIRKSIKIDYLLLIVFISVIAFSSNLLYDYGKLMLNEKPSNKFIV